MYKCMRMYYYMRPACTFNWCLSWYKQVFIATYHRLHSLIWGSKTSQHRTPITTNHTFSHVSAPRATLWPGTSAAAGTWLTAVSTPPEWPVWWGQEYWLTTHTRSSSVRTSSVPARSLQCLLKGKSLMISEVWDIIAINTEWWTFLLKGQSLVISEAWDIISKSTRMVNL